MVEVYAWEPNANSGKPPFCLTEMRVPAVFPHVNQFSSLNMRLARVSREPSLAGTPKESLLPAMGPEPGRWR